MPRRAGKLAFGAGGIRQLGIEEFIQVRGLDSFGN